jgi:hypothetical protein
MYHEEWPLLVLSPSSARYHWEAEFQQWLGIECTKRSNQTHNEQDDEVSEEGTLYEEHTVPMKPLNDWEIHVMTSGKEDVFPHEETRVVICSYGLAPSLVESGKIRPGMFKCTIVDER